MSELIPQIEAYERELDRALKALRGLRAALRVPEGVRMVEWATAMSEELFGPVIPRDVLGNATWIRMRGLPGWGDDRSDPPCWR